MTPECTDDGNMQHADLNRHRMNSRVNQWEIMCGSMYMWMGNTRRARGLHIGIAETHIPGSKKQPGATVVINAVRLVHTYTAEYTAFRGSVVCFALPRIPDGCWILTEMDSHSVMWVPKRVLAVTEKVVGEQLWQDLSLAHRTTGTPDLIL